MKLLATLLLPLSLFCQVPADLPHTFFGTGAGYSPASVSKAEVSTCLAILVNQAAGLYSDSCYNSVFYKGVPTVSTETGIMAVLRCIKGVCLMGSGTAGISSGTGITGAFSLGGALVWHHKSGFTVVLPMTWDKAGPNNNPVYRLLIGWSW